MKKTNVWSIAVGAKSGPNTWYVSVERNGFFRHYRKVGFYSILRLTRLVNNLVHERKGLLFVTTTGWVCVIPRHL